MKLLIDVDAVGKLAHWNLLSELESILKIPPARTCALASVKHRAVKSCTKPDGRLFKDVDGAARARAFCDQLSPLPSPDPEFIARIEGLAGVDPGEAVLLGVLALDQDSILLTGDKKALAALTASMSVEELAPLAGRCVVVEQFLLMCLQYRDIDWLRARLCPYRTLDKAIGIVLGSECSAPADAVTTGLRSYIEHARSNSDGLLVAQLH